MYLKNLLYIGTEPVCAQEYYQKKIQRKRARKGVSQPKEIYFLSGKLFIIDIMRESIQNDALHP